MSQIADIILGLFAFESDASILLYIAILGPWAWHFLNAQLGKKAFKAMDVINTVAAVIYGIVGVVLFIMIATGTTTDEGTGEEVHNTTAIAYALALSAVGVLMCAGLMLGFGIRGLVTNFRENGKTLIGVGLFVVVMVIAYSTASGNMPQDWAEQYNVTNQDYVDAGAGMIAVGILAGGAVLAILFGELLKLFR